MQSYSLYWKKGKCPNLLPVFKIELIYSNPPKVTSGWLFSVYSIMITELTISYGFQFIAVTKLNDAQIVLIFVQWLPQASS